MAGPMSPFARLSAFGSRAVWGGYHSGWGWLAAAIFGVLIVLSLALPSGGWKIAAMYGSLLFAVLFFVDQARVCRYGSSTRIFTVGDLAAIARVATAAK